MELNGFNSDDYIYLQYEFNNDKRIFRYNVNDLRRALLDHDDYGDIIEFVPRDNITKYDIFPHQIYKGVIVKETGRYAKINIRSKSFIIIDDEFKKRFLSSRVSYNIFGPISYYKENTNELNQITKKETIYDSKISFLSQEHNNQEEALTCLGLQYLDSPLNLEKYFNQNNIEKVYQTNYTFDLYFDVKNGDFLSFDNITIALLFVDQKFASSLANTHFLNPEDELELFKKDFENRIPDGRIYYKLNDNIKVKNITDFKNGTLFPKDFNHNVFFNSRVTRFGWNELDDYDLDNDGYVRYVWIEFDKYLEEEILKIASVCSLDEATDHHEHFRQRKKLEDKAFKYYCNHKRIYKRMKKENPNLTYIEFIKLNEDKLAEQKFYKNRKNNNNSKFIDGEDEIKYQATRLVKALKQIKPSSDK